MTLALTDERLRELVAKLERAARNHRKASLTYAPLSDEACTYELAAKDCDDTAALARAVIEARAMREKWRDRADDAKREAAEMVPMGSDTLPLLAISRELDKCVNELRDIIGGTDV